MKRLILGATLCVALAATSCSKVETVDINQEAMEFGVTTNATTRATTYTVSNLTTFYATGWSHGTVLWESVEDLANLSAFMTKETFTVKNSSTAEPVTDYYWPSTNYISLFATSEEISLTTPANAGEYPSFSYSTVGTSDTTVQETTNTEAGYKAYAVSTLSDLLIGSVTDKNSTNTTSAVAFSLDHALAKVSFNVKSTNDSYTYTVTAVRMNDLITEETFTFKAAVDNAVDGSWTNTGTTKVDYELSGLSVTGLSTSSNTALAETATNEFIVMPQTFKGWILVKYKVDGIQNTEYWATALVTDTYSSGIGLVAGSQTTFNIILPETGGTVIDPTVPETDVAAAPTAMTFTVEIDNTWTTTTDSDFSSDKLTATEV